MADNILEALKNPELQGHLNELRHRLVMGVGAIVLSMLLAFWLSLPVIHWLTLLAPKSVAFVQLSPGELLFASFKITVLLGVFLASPVCLYQGIRFVSPGLHTHEKRWLFWLIVGGSLFFLLGVLFAYWLLIPPALLFLLDYGQTIAPSQLSIATFLSFCISLILLTGLVFEMPIVLWLMALLGWIRSGQLLQHWRGAVVVIVFLAAILTPSQDPLSMLILAVALLALYALSILPIRLSGR